MKMKCRYGAMKCFVALTLFVALLGCSTKKKPDATPEPPKTSIGDEAGAMVSSSKDGSASSSSSATTTHDLLHDVYGAEVAVSSNVDNPKDFPEHLVDGKPETAWNSKTGDLKGWIAFEVPAGTHVTQILLTVGFDKKNAEGDLFTMNHRIKKVRVTRGADEKVGEFTLDVEKRAPQAIAVDRPGGKFRVEVLETVPGSMTKWKELVVSEFGVLGRADPKPSSSKKTTTKHLPNVSVGALRGVKLTKENRASVRALFESSSPASFCAEHVAYWKPINEAHTGYPGPLPFSCTFGGSVMQGAPVAPFTDAIVVARDEDEQHISSVAFQVDGGKTWHFNAPELFTDSTADPHCSWYGNLYETVVTFHAIADAPPGPGGGVALVRWHTGEDSHMFIPNEDGGLDANIHSTINSYAMTCRKTAANLTCDKVVEVDKREEDRPLEDFKTWRSTKTVKVKKDGTLDF